MGIDFFQCICNINLFILYNPYWNLYPWNCGEEELRHTEKYSAWLFKQRISISFSLHGHNYKELPIFAYEKAMKLTIPLTKLSLKISTTYPLVIGIRDNGL